MIQVLGPTTAQMAKTPIAMSAVRLQERESSITVHVTISLNVRSANLCGLTALSGFLGRGPELLVSFP